MVRGMQARTLCPGSNQPSFRPTQSPADEADIVALLCTLLEPIGAYRRQYTKHSKGRRPSSRKRKRTSTNQNPPAMPHQPTPPPPEISAHILVGFNTNVRFLESLAKRSKPRGFANSSSKSLPTPTMETHGNLVSLPVVFVCRDSLPSLLTASLPILAAAASSGLPEEPPVRLVPLRKESEEKLVQALNQPKAGFVGVMSSAPGSEGLVEIVRKRVGSVDVPWLQEVASGQYLPVDIRQTEVQRGPRRTRKGVPKSTTGRAC